MRCRNQGAHFGGVVGRVSWNDALGFRDQGVSEGLIKAILYQDSGGAEADLTLVGERRADRVRDGVLEVTIREDDSGILAAEFQAQFFEHPRSGAGNVGPGLGAAGKGNRFDLWVLDQGLSGLMPEAVNDIEHSGWKPRFSSPI